jgi:hypothetical protein
MPKSSGLIPSMAPGAATLEDQVFTPSVQDLSDGHVLSIVEPQSIFM